MNVKVDFAIVTATPLELRAIVTQVGAYRKVKAPGDNHIYFRGRIPVADRKSSYEVVIVTLRQQGTKDASATTTQLINTWQPRFVLLVGIAGGIEQDDLMLGDVVVADQVYDYEFVKIGTTQSERPRMTPANAELLGAVRSILLDESWGGSWGGSIRRRRPSHSGRHTPKHFVGPIGSGDKLWTNKAAQKRLLKHCPKMHAVEMEAAGFVSAAEGHDSRPGWLVIRGISDMADEQKDDRWQPYAAAAAAAFAWSCISNSMVKPRKSRKPSPRKPSSARPAPKSRLQKERTKQQGDSLLDQIRGLPTLAYQQPVEAIKRYLEFEDKAEVEDEWNTEEIHRVLARTKARLRRLDWQRPLLDEAAEALKKQDLRHANTIAGMMRRMNNGAETGLVADMIVTIGYVGVRAKGQAAADRWLAENPSVHIVPALAHVLDEYGSDNIRALIVPALADLAGRVGYVCEIQKQLGRTSDGRKILEDPAFAEPLQRLSEGTGAPLEAQKCAHTLRSLRLSGKPWLRLWPDIELADPPPLADWLQSVHLTHNPFGPNSAELDRHLPEHAAYDHVDMARGPRPVLIFGEPGSGRTATALLLAHDCDNPARKPREPHALPVYCRLSLAGQSSDLERHHIETMAHAMARALIQLVAARPYTWLDLPANRRDSLGTQLLASTGSKDRLLGEMRRATPETEYPRLARMISDLSPVFVPAERLDTSSWLDLLTHAFPKDYKHVYILADVDDIPAQSPDTYAQRKTLRGILTTYFDESELRDLCFELHIDYENLGGRGKADKARELIAYAERHERVAEIAEACRRLRPNAFRQEATSPLSDDVSRLVAVSFRALLSLRVRLAANAIHLKIFAPEAMCTLAPDADAAEAVSLTWNKAALSRTLKDRFRCAGGESFLALCGPDVPGAIDDRLVETALKAKGPPRELVRLGNQLLLRHAARSPGDKITWDEIHEVLPDMP